ncbi:MAG TPA: efflux RND transporter periplasmic adaptor subunit [Candidatus Acidoferrum sp.]|nr:efflux RND transporter periplasmic adaptor subunit [Candidatus Acidoferrum sp.]
MPGTVNAFQQATLYAKVGGYLKSIAVDRGDEVKQGALLAEIEVPELLADQTKYKAEVEVAALDFKRVEEAVKKAPDLVIAQAVDQARGKLAIAKANLERNETFLSFARMVAPFSGIVTRRMVDPGAFIPSATSGSAAQNAALLTLADFSKVRVQVAVPENEVKFITKGTPVAFTVEGLPGKNFEGAITRISFALDDATRTMLAEAEVENPGRELRPGMYASVRLFSEKKTDVLLLPSDAVLVEKAKTSVFLVENGKARKVPVKTGFADGASFEIIGVPADATVISIGKQSLNDGQPVQVKQ